MEVITFYDTYSLSKGWGKNVGFKSGLREKKNQKEIPHKKIQIRTIKGRNDEVRSCVCVCVCVCVCIEKSKHNHELMETI